MSDTIAQLRQFNNDSATDRKEIENYLHESTFIRTKREVKEYLAEVEKYRVSILKNVNTFASLKSEDLSTLARCLEEVYFEQGDMVIQQDDPGDAFYILEEGDLVVTVSL